MTYPRNRCLPMHQYALGQQPAPFAKEQRNVIVGLGIAIAALVFLGGALEMADSMWREGKMWKKELEQKRKDRS